MSTQTRTLKIEGVHCGRCAKKIRTSLLQTTGVADATVSAQDASATVSLESSTDDTTLREAVEGAGDYRVTGIAMDRQ